MNILTAIGSKAIGFIQANIDNRTDINGNPFKSYSFNYWFYKYYRKRYKGKKLRSKAGKKKWKAFLDSAHSAWQTDKSDITLSDTGIMLQSLDIIKTNSLAGSIDITIGFNDKESAQKAFYHNIGGAGRGRTLRKFLGLQKSQEEQLAEYAADLISKDKIFLAGLIKNLGLDIN